MAFNQPYEDPFSISRDEFLNMMQLDIDDELDREIERQQRTIEEPSIFSREEFLSMTEPNIDDELDREIERQDRIYDQDRRREVRRVMRFTPQEREEARRRREHEIAMARARIRMNPFLGLDVSPRDRILTRVSTPRLLVRQPQNFTIAEPVRSLEQQYFANSLPIATVSSPQQAINILEL